MKLIKVGENGEIHQVLNMSGFDQAPDGFVRVDDSLDDLVLIELHYLKDGELRRRLPRPSQNHIWILTTESWQLDLSMLRASKSYEIDQVCKLMIVSGFVSYALNDQPHHYPSNLYDQQNLAAAALTSYQPGLPLDWTAACYCSDATGTWSLVQHSGAQIRQVQMDANLAIETCRIRNQQLQAQISSAETAGEIESIAW